MKVIDKIEIEYVIPETAEEQAEIAATIKSFEADRNEKINFTKFKKTTLTHISEQGFWRMKNQGQADS